MFRLLLLSLSFIEIYAQEQCYVLAKKVDATKEEIKLQKNFSIDYKQYHIEAKYGKYEKNSSNLYLYKDIELLEPEYNLYGIKGTFNLKTDHFKLKDFLFSQSSTALWVDGEKIEGNNTKVSLESSFLSSCDMECSDWKFYFGWGTYYRNLHWVNLYNIVFFANDYPLFYLPYLGFSTLKKRQTGFLRPTFGVSDKEGFLYIQPFFYAPTNWWDLELDPQIRTKRGKGLYATFRFVDSPTSYGEITSGIFAEKRSYQTEYNIKNRYHRGAQIYYRRENIFSDQKSQDGFYADIKLYNDVDYFNLKKELGYGYSSSLDISRLNYYYSSDKDYLGISARYYKYNNKSSSTQQVHILPTLKYHRYVNVPWQKINFAYNADVEITHFYQKNGISAIEYNLFLPIKIYTTLFDNYLGVSATENLNYIFADYYNISHGDEKYKNYHLFRNGHEFALYGNVAKAYTEFFHSISYDARLFIPSYEHIGGDRVSYINITEAQQKRLDLALKNYFHFFEGEKLFYHFIKQRINYDEDQKLQDLENEFGFEKKNLDIYLSTRYSYDMHKVNAFALTGSYRTTNYSTKIGYLYRKRKQITDDRLLDSQFITFAGQSSLGNHNQLFATIDYNIKDRAYKEWSIGWKKRMKCWSFYARYKRGRVPIITPNGPSHYNENAILLRLELYPLGVIEKSIQTTSRKRNF